MNLQLMRRPAKVLPVSYRQFFPLIGLPAKNRWASRAGWWQLLKHGCRLWLTPKPFDHSKLMIVDGCWVLLGSANWDPRSLRLNFEYNLECYDAELARRMEKLIEARRAAGRQMTLEEMDRRPFGSKLRDGVARLLTPYL